MTNAIPTEGSPAEPPVPRVLRREEVLRRVPVSIDTITRMVKAGSFPAPIQLGPQAVGWLEHEVSQWISAAHRLWLRYRPEKRVPSGRVVAIVNWRMSTHPGHLATQ